jgi:hypothetical protein
MEQQAPVETNEINTTDLAGKTIVCSVTLNKVGATRKVRGCDISDSPNRHAPINTDSDADSISVSKRILDCSEYDAIRAADQRLKKFLGQRCLPSQLKRGMYLLPTSLVADVDEELGKRFDERADLVDKFIAVYEQDKAQAKAKLRDLYYESDYPDVTDIKSAFAVEVRYLTLGVPAVLKKIKAEIFQREQEKVRRVLEDDAANIRQALRQSMADLCDRMVTCLGYEGSGQKRKFTKSVSHDVRDFLDNFMYRDLTGDSILSDLVHKAKGLLDGIDDKELKTDTDTRDKMRLAFEQLAAKLEQSTEVKPKRKYTLAKQDPEQQAA